MGIFTRIKGAVSSRANAALDSAIDPAKELDLKIAELEAGHRKALEELVTYRATAKMMEQDIARLTERAQKLEQGAMAAVRAGDDELARRCLKEGRDASAELARVVHDRDEMAGHAVRLNRSRKELEPRLRILRMRKGTLATQLTAARSGTGNPLGIDDTPFERLLAAEERIEHEAAVVEATVAVEGGDPDGASASPASIEGRLLAAEASAGGDDALAALKARMDADKIKKLGK